MAESSPSAFSAARLSTSVRARANLFLRSAALLRQARLVVGDEDGRPLFVSAREVLLRRSKTFGLLREDLRDGVALRLLRLSTSPLSALCRFRAGVGELRLGARGGLLGARAPLEQASALLVERARASRRFRERSSDLRVLPLGRSAALFEIGQRLLEVCDARASFGLGRARPRQVGVEGAFAGAGRGMSAALVRECLREAFDLGRFLGLGRFEALDSVGPGSDRRPWHEPVRRRAPR